MTRAREITLMLLTAGIIFFAGQNLASVDVTFLWFHFQVPLALITLVPLLAGLVIGVAGTVITLGRRQRGAEPESGGAIAGAEDDLQAAAAEDEKATAEN